MDLVKLREAQAVLEAAVAKAQEGAKRLGMKPLSSKLLSVEKQGSILTFWTTTSKVEVQDLRTTIWRR